MITPHPCCSSSDLFCNSTTALPVRLCPGVQAFWTLLRLRAPELSGWEARSGVCCGLKKSQVSPTQSLLVHPAAPDSCPAPLVPPCCSYGRVGVPDTPRWMDAWHPDGAVNRAGSCKSPLLSRLPLHSAVHPLQALLGEAPTIPAHPP